MIHKDKGKRETKENKVTMGVTESENYIMDNIHEKNFRRENYLKRGHVFDLWT